MGNIQIWYHFSLVTKIIFQFDCESEHKQVKWNKIKQNMCKSDIVFPYLQSNTLFKWLLKFISWYSLSQNEW